MDTLEKTKVIRQCGTLAAYKRHIKKKETTCVLCRKAMSEYVAELRKNNPEHFLEMGRKYRKANAEKIALGHKKYRKENPEKMAAHQKKYYDSKRKK